MIPTYLSVFLFVDVLFAATGGLLIAVVVISRHAMSAPTMENVAPNLLLAHAPLNGALADASLIFLTFVTSVPGLILSKNRSWLRIHSWMVLACITVTLVIGLDVWFSTLKTRSNLAVMWNAESSDMQRLLQQRFKCCGYMTLPFHTDSTCPSGLDALSKPNCVGPLSDYANSFLDLVFTAMFGIVGLSAILFLCGLVVLKKRGEEQRYRHIDEKSEHNNRF